MPIPMVKTTCIASTTRLVKATILMLAPKLNKSTIDKIFECYKN